MFGEKDEDWNIYLGVNVGVESDEEI